MKRAILGTVVISLLSACGCQKKWEEETTVWQAPNWTSDGKIVFLEHDYVQKLKETVTGNAQDGGSEKITVCEINNDGSGLKRIATIRETDFDCGPTLDGISSSSVGDWVALSIEDWNRGDHYPVMYVIKRDGTGRKELGSGRYPDLAPDTSRFVYEKPNQGLWIMSRDGTGDHQVVSDGSSPAWSPGGKRIAYVSGELVIVDTNGSTIDSLGAWKISPDWSVSDTAKLMVSSSHPYWILLIDLTSSIVDTFPLTGSHLVRWSPNGNQLIEYDSGGCYVIKTDGTNKWYLKP
jgi:Tol biopolymer transport system component